MFDNDTHCAWNAFWVKHWSKAMNSDIAEGKWRQVKGSVKEKWGKLTDDDLQEVNGRFEKFCGKMQERYGMSREEAEDEFNRFR